jgi:hypothetical protein
VALSRKGTKRRRESILFDSSLAGVSRSGMPRRLRCNTGGYVYHMLNRGVARAALFHKDHDYAAFEKVLRQAKDWQPMRVLSYCLMPNHWHPGPLAGAGRGLVGIPALADGDAHAALPCAMSTSSSRSDGMTVGRPFMACRMYPFCMASRSDA